MITKPRPATSKQLAFIKSLVQEKDITAIVETVDAARIKAMKGQFATGDASNLIDLLMKQPKLKVAEVVKVRPAPEGMHKIGDRIFKVQVAVHGSGNLYAKELVAAGLGRDGKTAWKFEFARGAMKLLSEETLMSLDQAKQFGALYGTCCVCGRTLTNETSIEEGIGPVCSGRFDR